MITGRRPQRSSLIRRGTHGDHPGAPVYIEIMGPAAVGKSTLVRELCARDGDIRAGIRPSKIAYVGPTVRRLGVFLAAWLRLRPARPVGSTDARCVR